MRKLLLFAGLTLLATGCASSQSKDVATSGIYADMSAKATGDGQTTVVAALKVGGATSNDFLDLSPTDQLVASLDAATAEAMTRQEALGDVWYQKVFATDSAGAAIQVSFLRSPSDSIPNPVSAPDSHVTMPAPFTITAPASSATVSREAAVDVTWSGSGQSDPMTWSITGDCIQAVLAQPMTGDTGTLTIPAGTIVPNQGQGTSNCQATVEIRRSRSGLVDPAFGEGGNFAAMQVRTVSFLSTP